MAERQRSESRASLRFGRWFYVLGNSLMPARRHCHARRAGAYVPEPPVVIELTFADGTPIYPLQAVEAEPDRLS